MIERILINNSPAFELLELNLSPGFSVFSGPSGAGKSVFMESLLAIFGIKDSNADLIEVNIDATHMDGLKNALENMGIESDDSVVLSILKKERVRYFINHQASSKKALNDLIMGFGVHLSTKSASELESKNLLSILDAKISKNDKNHEEILTEHAKNFAALKAAQNELESLENEEKNIENLKEFAKFEIEKIQAAAPKSGEYERLLEQKKRLSKMDKISEQIGRVNEALNGFDALESFLALVDKKSEILADARLEVENIIAQVQGELEELASSDAESLLERVSALGEIVRKYGSEEAALEHLEAQKIKLSEYENIAFNKEKTLKEIARLGKALEDSSGKIAKNRAAALSDFNAELSEICEVLMLKNVALNLSDSPLNAQGKNIADISVLNSSTATLSSGEFNRVRLAIMRIAAAHSPKVGVMILDEIDANLSGQESEGVAKILKALSKSYQIFAISHQAHMPALADAHYLIKKDAATNRASLTKLDKNGRINEIARMISGADITDAALNFAETMLAKNAVV